jgi:hypothetical protein
LKVLASIVGAAIGGALVISGFGLLFGWLYTVLFPDRSTSATDLFEFGVWGAAIVGVIVGIVLVLGLAFWLVFRSRK